MKILFEVCAGRYPDEIVREHINNMNSMDFLQLISDGLSEILENTETPETPEPATSLVDKRRLQELLKCERRLNAIREACGYVENGSSDTIRIAQDDATGDWVVSIGDSYSNGHSEYGDTFGYVLDNLVDYNAKNPST